MILANATFEAIKRVTGTMPDISNDWSVCFWARPVSAIPGAAAYRTFFILMDGTYTNYIGVFQSDTGALGIYGVDSSNPDISIDYTTDGVNTYNKDYHVAITYNSGTNLITYYVNGVSIGTGTLDCSLITLTQMWAMDDSNGNWSNDAMWYFRFWERKLTVGEIIAEMSSNLVVGQANLFMNTPLTSDALDISGNSYDWTTVGSVTYFSDAPTNQYAISARVISSLPYSITQDVFCTLGYIPTVWYKWTATDSYVYGGFAFGALGGYVADCRVYSPDSTTAYLSSGGNNKPFQIPVINGDDYYFKITPDAYVSPTAVLTFSFQRAPQSAFPAGSIFVPDDTDGLPAAVINPSTQAVSRFINPFPAGECGDVLDNGKILVEDISTTGLMGFYSSAFALLASPTAPNAIKTIRLNKTLQTFYVSCGPGAPTAVKVYSVSNAGVLSSLIATLTGYVACLGGATSPAGDIFYFNGNGSSIGSNKIRRWDLVNDLALSDLATVPSGYPITDMLGLDDGSVIALTFKGTVTRDVIAYHYSSAGSLLHTYSIGTGWDSTSPKLAYAINHPNSFWVWCHKSGFSEFREVEVATGTILTTVTIAEFEGTAYQPAVSATPTRFGNSFSCPFMLLPIAAFRNSYSGLYALSTSSRHDTLVDDQGNNVDLAIPNPFIETALVPTED